MPTNQRAINAAFAIAIAIIVAGVVLLDTMRQPRTLLGLDPACKIVEIAPLPEKQWNIKVNCK